MFMFNEFLLQGYVGEVRVATGFVEIDVAVSKPETGAKRGALTWNTVTVPAAANGYDWARTKLSNGDLVHVRGEIAKADPTQEVSVCAHTALFANHVSFIPLRKVDPTKHG